MNFKKTLAFLMLALGVAGVASCGPEDTPIEEQSPPVEPGEQGGETGGTTGGEQGGSTGGETGGTTFDLEAAIKDAKAELSQYALGKVAAVTDEAKKAEAQTAVVALIPTENAKIDAATDQAGVTAALTAAKSAVDAAIDAVVNAVDPALVEHEVATAQDFLDMMANATVGIYKLTADIDLSSSAVTASMKTFKGTLDGQGHTVKFNKETPIAVPASGGLVFDQIEGATIKNITFDGINMVAGGDGVGVFGYATSSTIENVLISNVKATLTRYGGLIAGKACGDMVLTNVAVTNYDITAGDYCGVLIGDLTNSVNSANTEVNGGTLVAKGILLSGTFAGGTQCAGGVIGLVDNKVDTMTVEIDGLVGQGSISGGKNVSLGVGSFKAAGASLTVKNILALDLDLINKNDVAGDATKVKMGIGFGLSNLTAAETVSNVKGIDKITKLIQDSNADGVSDLDVSNLAEYVALDQVTAPSTAFTIADGQISLGTLASIAMPQPVLTSDVATGVLADGAEDAAIGAVSGTEITFSGTIGYFHKAVAGFAGNGVAIKIDAATGVDTTGATVQIGTETAVAYNSGEVIYVPFTSLQDTTTITVVWSEASNPQTYTVKYDQAAQLEEAPIYGAISQSSADLTATAEGNTITYTAGEIAYNADVFGNSVVVTVAKPAWISDASGVVATGATVQGTVLADATSVDVLVKVSEGETKFKVQWSETTDASEYVVVVNGATLQVNPNAASTVTLDVTTLTAETTGYTENKVINETFTILSTAAKPARVDGIATGDATNTPTRINLSKGKMATDANAVQITLTAGKTATIAVRACSSKKAAAPLASGLPYTLGLMSAGSVTQSANIPYSDATDAKTTTVTFENVSGTVLVGGVEAGCYIYEIIVTYNA